MALPLAADLAADLVRIGAVALSPDQPYTWASGLKSPIYCDNRLTLAYPEVRAAIADSFVGLIHTLRLRPDVIAGTATAGIPHAAWVAERLGLPMAYIRSSPKDHGKQNRVEGRIMAGQRVVVIEDLISTGGSSLAAVDAVREVGGEPVAVLAIFSYGFERARVAFEAAGVPFETLTDFPTLAEVAAQSGALAPDALATLAAWRADPQAWSAQQ